MNNVIDFPGRTTADANTTYANRAMEAGTMGGHSSNVDLFNAKGRAADLHERISAAFWSNDKVARREHIETAEAMLRSLCHHLGYEIVRRTGE